MINEAGCDLYVKIEVASRADLQKMVCEAVLKTGRDQEG